MHKEITHEQQQEILQIIRLGGYKHRHNSNETKTHIEFLGLALLKYIVYADIQSWRWGFAALFKGGEECGLTKGKRTKATAYLHKIGAVYPVGKRWICRDRKTIIEKMNLLEIKIKK